MTAALEAVPPPIPSKSGVRYTDADRAHALDLLRSGWTQAAVAREFNCSKQTVSAWKAKDAVEVEKPVTEMWIEGSVVVKVDGLEISGAMSDVAGVLAALGYGRE